MTIEYNKSKLHLNYNIIFYYIKFVIYLEWGSKFFLNLK